MMLKKQNKKIAVLVNKKARRDYQLGEEVEAGIVLGGIEVKSIRAGKGRLSEAFCKVINGEIWLHNFLIPAFQENQNYDSSKSRKLLLNKKEILSLAKKMEGKNLSLVPLKAYFKNRRLKVLLALGKGKKVYEKKEDKKRKDIQRELRRQFKEEVIG